MKINVNVNDLCDKLDERYIENISLENNSESLASAKNIKKLTMNKIHQQNATEKKEKEIRPMKKSIKGLLLVAVIASLSISAFALEGMGFFKSIFGESIKNVEGDIISPMVVAEDKDIRMVVESILSDGYNSKIVVSLEGLSGDGKKLVSGYTPCFTMAFENKDEIALQSTSELPEFATDNKKYYYISCESTKSNTSSAVNVQLQFWSNGSDDVTCDLTGKVTLKNIDNVTVVLIDEKAYEDTNHALTQINLSPFGAMAMGKVKDPSKEISFPEISILFKDGSEESIFDVTSFGGPTSEATSMGGGSVSLYDASDKNIPLATEWQWTKNQLNTVFNARFTKIIDFNDIKSISVDGEIYLLK